MLEQYLSHIIKTSNKGDAREESYYGHLEELIKRYAESEDIRNIDITILPKQTEGGNPDFRIWDGKNHVTGYIEVKDPSNTNLDLIEENEQLQRYRDTFPNVILTNLSEFRLYRDGKLIAQTAITRPLLVKSLRAAPPVENVAQFKEILDKFFLFRQPRISTAKALAVELAKRTRFLRDEVISVELGNRNGKGHKQIHGFYHSFRDYLIPKLTEESFADLYSQTITYGLFAARTRTKEDFNRTIAFNHIPHTIGILRDVFRYISLEDPPESLRVIVEDIAAVLNAIDVNKILYEYYQAGKGNDPIIHFYETFLSTYDPEIREKRGVYYTPEAVVGYIVRSIHSLLKSRFGLADGLASEDVKLLDPAGGTLTFPAEAIRLAAKEFREKYGSGALNRWIKGHVLEDFYAFELMMAPYAIGHLKMGFIFAELGYEFEESERFKLYLTNALEMEEIQQVDLPGLRSLSEESREAGKIKKSQPILVIMGNPPYSGISANFNGWTEQLLKEDVAGSQSYYTIDGEKLKEKNPKWLQDDYVKFLRFAQWKIHTSGCGIVGMITNHSYLDNPTFRGMRQSLIKGFDEIYVIDLHGNSLKKEKTPEGGKDENVFDIRQGVAITLFIKNKEPKSTKVFHRDLYGLRREKEAWLNNNHFSEENYAEIKPQTPYYFLVKRDTDKIKKYLNWYRINDIFPINSVGVVTSRDKFVIDIDKNELKNRILQFTNNSQSDDVIARAFDLKDKSSWSLHQARKRVREIEEWESCIQEILYRPFDKRYIFYHSSLVERMRYEVMQNMIKDNIALITHKREELSIDWSHAFVTDSITEHGMLSSKTTSYQFPLYAKINERNNDIFDGDNDIKEPNIASGVLDKITSLYNKKLTPEEIFHYIYAIFYSNIYRLTYAEYLKIDFPRVPFTSDYELFKAMAEKGEILTTLHLLKSPLLDTPMAKYQGPGDNDRIERVDYAESEQRIYLNKDKYFEGVAPEVWNYYIGGYQVLNKYLKDRKKDRRNMEDAPHYCRIITALSKTIEIQKQIDEIYPGIEEDLI
ncbi:MAG: DNA methyltransferase [candidate division Zixibacteria bacterium]|nr:DNA methyltransferase [candidate division Zixibacteria bacterium]